VTVTNPRCSAARWDIIGIDHALGGDPGGGRLTLRDRSEPTFEARESAEHLQADRIVGAIGLGMHRHRQHADNKYRQSRTTHQASFEKASMPTLTRL